MLKFYQFKNILIMEYVIIKNILKYKIFNKN